MADVADSDRSTGKGKMDTVFSSAGAREALKYFGGDGAVDALHELDDVARELQKSLLLLLSLIKEIL